ncbi:hypothetical protein CO116_01240 [Candidatus Falkowbacteria bacterium CG_4_9_14_3_um_filter_38_19]|uniref:Uncharacterized protein n=2 Tax=Candidatus Falkowiibacteriota TaxID=1752728 RepID=A0A2M6WRM5_9BACT|nr:hypothetical protein [Candidatus Falkowbacteria bacterium]PIT95459.1 MAG: hypothetical protein COT96_01195 [Candidatus Falkowbacteria bacterium CG10_big_fil_rev_8_21_14_0_10_38_22]PJB17207.1 MAG: hypothetical protein CO116_01240 [Candidatus Falkowbacteria bacterium CG_4_9_14_3_um_filter_38_19]
MSHHCPAAVITCEDFRLHQRLDGRNCLAEFIRDLSSRKFYDFMVGQAEIYGCNKPVFLFG